MLLRRVEHLGIMVRDLDRSIDFYRNILGFTLRDRRVFGSVQIGFVRLGEFELELICGVSGYQTADSQINHLAFTVDNVDAAVRELRSRMPALEFTSPMQLWDRKKCVFFRGIDDERLELFGD